MINASVAMKPQCMFGYRDFRVAVKSAKWTIASAENFGALHKWTKRKNEERER